MRLFLNAGFGELLGPPCRNTEVRTSDSIRMRAQCLKCIRDEREVTKMRLGVFRGAREHPAPVVTPCRYRRNPAAFRG